MSEPEAIRDSWGRDIRIYGLVVDEAHPARTLRELLRQWSVSDAPSDDLRERTDAVLRIVGPSGEVERDAE